MKYAKSLMYVVVAAAVFIQGAVADGLTLSDWAGTAGAAVTALGIYVVPNIKDAGVLAYAKAAVAVGGAVTSGLVLALTNSNLSDVEIWSIFTAAAGAIGVVAVPNVGARVLVAVPSRKTTLGG